MKPLRLVMVMPEPPLPFGHASARWYYLLLKGLLEGGHDVTVFAAASKKDEVDSARAMFPSSTVRLRCYPVEKDAGWRSKWSALREPCSYIFSPALRRDLATRLEGAFDALHLEQVWAGWLGAPYPHKSLLHVHNLWAIDLAGGAALTPLDFLRTRRLFQAERTIVSRIRNICCCSRRLQDQIRRVNTSAAIHELPPALDLTGYPYMPDVQRSQRITVSLIGNMTWRPTVSAARRLLAKLWPAIKRAIPQATVQIVGWGARDCLAEFTNMPDVAIEENVPDIAPYFARSSILLYAPSQGSGMKIKVLEALAYGIPVVTNREGIEGIPARDGIHAAIADDDAGLVDRAIALLKNPGLQNAQRLLGRRLLEAECSPRNVLDRVYPIYRRIAAEAA